MKALVAVDGSEASENALAYAADVVDAMGGSITVVHAVDPTVYDEGGSEPISSLSDADQRLIIESVEDAEQRGQAVLDDAVELAAERGHDVESEHLYGDPVPVIADYAEVEGFDTIFVGHQGRSERAGLMLGSVAKSLVERATVPVTVVR
ncbi:universal stress protein [Halosolutus amylolyticus]|uniref:Universal stress protein n=1 Tax=Halosolutus amylolyticus TaxID=2932267 RepID=A0ABD5PLF6_9EURY|nr:universal stress protein [Halosolutus amylolyticus]